jgi:hypothetical protein
LNKTNENILSKNIFFYEKKYFFHLFFSLIFFNKLFVRFIKKFFFHKNLLNNIDKNSIIFYSYINHCFYNIQPFYKSIDEFFYYLFYKFFKKTNDNFNLFNNFKKNNNFIKINLFNLKSFSKTKFTLIFNNLALYLFFFKKYKKCFFESKIFLNFFFKNTVFKNNFYLFKKEFKKNNFFFLIIEFINL